MATVNTKKKDRIFITQINSKISGIDYQIQGDAVGNFNINEERTVAIGNVCEENFIITTKLEIILDPALFKLEVDCLLTCFLDKDKTDKELLGNLVDLRKYIEGRKYNIVNNTAIWANTSLLIAEITSKFGGQPLFVNPYFDPNEKSTD